MKAFLYILLLLLCGCNSSKDKYSDLTADKIVLVFDTEKKSESVLISDKKALKKLNAIYNNSVENCSDTFPGLLKYYHNDSLLRKFFVARENGASVSIMPDYGHIMPTAGIRCYKLDHDIAMLIDDLYRQRPIRKE